MLEIIQRFSPEGSCAILLLDEASGLLSVRCARGDLDGVVGLPILPGLLENRAKVFYAMGTHPEFDQRVVGWVNGLRATARLGRHPPQEFVALDHVLHDMRLFKSRREIELMRESARIAAAAHVRAMRRCRARSKAPSRASCSASSSTTPRCGSWPNPGCPTCTG